MVKLIHKDFLSPGLSKKQWQQIFFAIGEPTVLLNKNHKVIAVNQAVAEKTGKSPKELKGTYCYEIFHEKGCKAPPSGCPFEKMLSTNKLETVEMEMNAFDGTYLVSCTPITDNKGNLEFVFHIATDISERKKMELEMIKAKEKAQESDRLKSAFLANMSHEIRTPMNGILGFAELLKNPSINQEKKERYIELINNNGKQLLSIINDVVYLSKIESEQFTLSKKAFNLNIFMNNIMSTINSKLPPEKSEKIAVNFHNHLIDKNLTIISDENRISQILYNLINNAIKYTHEGEINIECKLAGNNELQFTISDTGIGIPDDKTDIIFEQFRQIDDSLTRKFGGAGLGLTISKKLVELLGGEIWFNSIVNKGTTFVFKIPFKTNKKTKIEDTPSDVENHNYNNKNILIIEDDPSSLELLKNYLENTNANIYDATNKKDALSYFTGKSNFHLVFLDIQLPETNGYELLKKFRAKNKHTPVIAQTAHALSEDKNKCLSHGFDDYISKPITISKFNKILHKYLG